MPRQHNIWNPRLFGGSKVSGKALVVVYQIRAAEKDSCKQKDRNHAD